jgi:FixJ family two-component response regulator/signal transduction histidine kinase
MTANVTPRGAGDVPLLDRLAFERLLADLLARLASVSSDRIVAEIERALVELVDFLGYDRCTFSEFADDGTLNVLCSAAVGGFEPLPRGPFGASLRWFVGELRAGRMVALATIPDEFPPEAAAEAEHCRRIGLRSHLSIPLRIGGRVIGVLSFAGLRSARTWPDEVITRLTIIGEVFANAMSRMRSEKEVQRLRARLWHADRVARIGALGGAIAHELNQPLTAILSNAQAGLTYLDRGEASLEELRAILAAVVHDDKRAVETIRTMRAFLRREATGRARIDLAAALREVLRLLAVELDRHGIRIETEFATGCWVIADQAQIEQVVLNLVLNAAAAMAARPQNERLLRLSVSRAEDGRVVATVCDSGEGIAAEHVEEVFEPFWTTREEGLGLGLAICRSIVEGHGGVMRVDPNLDRGVTVRFELEGEAPGGTGEMPGAPAAARASGAPAEAAGEPAVCVVDDDATVRESLVRVLEAAGWTAMSYASAGEFLDRGSLADVACLLLDVRMPGMSGLELQQLLSARGAAPPIVFLTGHAEVAAGIDAMKLGAVDFLAKPVDDAVLIGAVRTAVERHAGERKRWLEQEACRTLVDRLTAREREIMAHVIRGRLNKQIAADLDIAEQTVKQHRGRVMEKMEVDSLAELVRVCEAAGLFASERPAA